MNLQLTKHKVQNCSASLPSLLFSTQRITPARSAIEQDYQNPIDQEEYLITSMQIYVRLQSHEVRQQNSNHLRNVPETPPMSQP